ncbi:MAG: DUF2283 domain-containing protein [Candidatus Paceibacterota bacterium]|jgi:uncharacterized protein YuzE
MIVQYDNIADAAYLRISETKPSETRKIEDRLIIDTDKDGNIVGIEILDFSSNKIGLENLKKNVENGVPVEMIASTPTSF